jgi:hypothetical protein
MPNWCSNGVEIRHRDPAKIAALAEAMRKNEFLNHIIPVPEELKETMAGSYGDPEEQRQLEEQTARNIEKYGYGNWYDFCVNRWGTKWDVDLAGTVSIDADGLGLSASFDSAWAPPIQVYEEMLEQGYEVVAYYYEPGMEFVGKWDNGYDLCHQLGIYNSSTVRNAIGDELDDYFGISENMAEWESENEEEEEELTEWIKEGAEHTLDK